MKTHKIIENTVIMQVTVDLKRAMPTYKKLNKLWEKLLKDQRFTEDKKKGSIVSKYK